MDEEKLITLNIFPLVIESLSKNKKITRSINKLYDEYKYQAYKLTKEHWLYDKPLMNSGSLSQDILKRKILGLLALKDENEKYKEEITKELLKILKQGFPYTYSYVERVYKVDFEDYLIKFKNKFNKDNKVTKQGMGIDDTMVILPYIANLLNVELIQNDTLVEITNIFNLRSEFHLSEKGPKIRLDNVPVLLKEKVNKLSVKLKSLDAFPKSIFDIPSVCIENPWEFIPDFEDLSIVDIGAEYRLSEKEVKELILSYLVTLVNGFDVPEEELNKQITNIDLDKLNMEEFTKYIYGAVYYRLLFKAYKDVKEIYFKNNKETLYIDFIQMQKQLEKRDNEIKRINSLNETGQDLINKKQKEIDRLKEELNQAKMYKSELDGLRNLMFSMEQEEEIINEEKIESLSDKGIFIGGHDNLQSKLKERLPNFTFISTDQMNFDAKILDNYDKIYIYTGYLSHALYYKVVENINDQELIYIEHTNTDKILEKINATI